MTTPRIQPAPSVEEVLKTSRSAPETSPAPPGAKPHHAPGRKHPALNTGDHVSRALGSLHERHATATEKMAADGPTAGVGELPGGLGDIGQYVQRLMQEAHAAADAYRAEAEAGAHRSAGEIVAAATREADDVRKLATAEAEAILAAAQGAVAERLNQITVVIDRLIALAEGVVDNPAAAAPVNANALRLVGVLVSAADTAAAYLDEHLHSVGQTTSR